VGFREAAQKVDAAERRHWQGVLNNAMSRLRAATDAKDVEAIRIEDDFGDVVYYAAYSAEMEEKREIISNSNVLLWKPACEVTEGYMGSYTVYATRDGQEIPEGLRCSATLNIAAPKVEAPAMQAFTCDTAISELPVQITFTVTTSSAVSAVRVVDDNNNPIVSMYEGDAASGWVSLSEEGDVRVWTLSTEITSPYTGSYSAQYMLEDGLSFTPSGYSVPAQLGNEPAPVIATPTPTTCVSNSARISVIPFMLPPPLMKSSIIRAFVPLKAALFDIDIFCIRSDEPER